MKQAAVIVHPPHLTDSGRTAVATVELAERVVDVSFSAAPGPLSMLADPFAAVALLPAMRLAAPLRVVGAISPLLLENASTLQDVYHAWYPNLQRIAIEAAPAQPALVPPGRATGCFFNGDVASFFTLYRHQSTVTHLIVARGLDVPDRVRATLEQAGAALDKPVLTVESNARSLLDGFVDWQTQSRGAALAGVAHALAPQCGQIYAPSALPYFRLTPFGSHPLLDRLWQSESMHLIHDGAQATPWQKALSVLGQAVARRYLRVCRNSDGSSYNCGVCADCLAMMACVRGLGREGELETLPPLSDLELLRAMPLPTRTERASLDELRLLLTDERGAPDVIAALDDCLSRYPAPEHELPWTLRMRTAQAALFSAQDELHAARATPSWRLTDPLRRMGSALRGRRDKARG